MIDEVEDENLGLKITPFGVFIREASKMGIPPSAAEELWMRLEGFCLRRLRELDPDAHYAGLTFDGHGGQIFGVGENDDD